MAEPKKRGRPRKVKETATVIQTEPPRVNTQYVLVDKARMQRKRTELNPEPFSVYDTARKLVESEFQAYENGSSLIRETLKRVYRNYLGYYEQPIDPYTNRKKIFTSLTHDIVDSVSKPVKVNGASVRIVPLTKESRGKAKVLNMVLPYFFQQMGFEEMMNQLIHRLAWFGGQVTVQDWLYEETEQGKNQSPTTEIGTGFQEEDKEDTATHTVKIDRPRVRLVDILDIYCPSTAESLPWAVKNASVILRSVETLYVIQGNKNYNDEAKAKLVGWTTEKGSSTDSTSLNRWATGGTSKGGLSKSAWGNQYDTQKNPMVTLYERYGQIPKSWVTGKKEDEMINVAGIITTASNSGNASGLVVLSVRFSPFGEYGAFEECHYNKIPRRWLGEGLGERLIGLQAWHNEIVNCRRNNELLIQNRMFLYRKGSVDPSQFYARPAGGIPVENISDVQWLPTPDVQNSSFNEDANIFQSAQRLAGSALTPVSKKQTATEANITQANSNLTYSELRSNVELYVERLVLKHLIPLLKRFFKKETVIPVEMSIKELEVLDSFNGYAPDVTEKIGRERFLMIDDDSIFDGDFAVTVDIDSVPQSREAQVAKLMEMLNLASKIQNSGVNIPATFRKIAELNGIVDDRLFQDAETALPTGVTNPNQAPTEPPMASQPPMAPQEATQGAEMDAMAGMM